MMCGGLFLDYSARTFGVGDAAGMVRIAKYIAERKICVLKKQQLMTLAVVAAMVLATIIEKPWF